jgi:hypothetical protein
VIAALGRRRGVALAQPVCGARIERIAIGQIAQAVNQPLRQHPASSQSQGALNANGHHDDRHRADGQH